MVNGREKALKFFASHIEFAEYKPHLYLISTTKQPQ
jgi:hypothetical protein